MNDELRWNGRRRSESVPLPLPVTLTLLGVTCLVLARLVWGPTKIVVALRLLIGV